MIVADKNPALMAMFRAYTRRYLARSFHAISLLGDLPILPPEGDCLPVVACLNHSSWWDVMMGIYVATDVLGMETWSVMDARQLERYKFFARLGIIGVDRTSIAGAKAFVDYAANLLKGRSRALWITPQGAMLSNHARPIRFQPGIGALAEQLGDFYSVTIAFHYEFWDERLPEAFVSISAPERITVGPEFRRKTFVRDQERRLETQLDALLLAVQSRDMTLFRPLMRGHIGISPLYDAMRGLAARLRGERFSAEHGDTLSPQWKEEETRK